MNRFYKVGKKSYSTWEDANDKLYYCQTASAHDDMDKSAEFNFVGYGRWVVITVISEGVFYSVIGVAIMSFVFNVILAFLIVGKWIAPYLR